MKKLLFFILFISITKAFAQGNDCGTKVKGSPIIFSQKKKDSLNAIMAINQPYAIKIWVTVFADNDGTNRAASDADIRRQIQNMANQYQPHNICFMLMGITQVNNSDLNDHNVTSDPATDESAEVIPFFVGSNLNIFIHNALPGLNGIAYNIPNTYLSIWGGIIEEPQNGNITTLGHEMGHCLGLYHTFEPWTDNAGNPTNKENVARNGVCKNCTTAGDVLCDTPADDDGGVNVSCVYTGGGMDACNVVYTPMTNNMMAYGNRVCRNTFTGEQGIRMRYFLINDGPLNSFLVNDLLYLPPSANSNYSYSFGIYTYVARDFIGISQFSNNIYDVSGSATFLMVSKKVSLKPGTRFHPSTGRVQITANPYCQ